jgi:hypothetical protein
MMIVYPRGNPLNTWFFEDGKWVHRCSDPPETRLQYPEKPLALKPGKAYQGGQQSG